MAIGTCKFKRQIGGRGNYAFVRLETEPTGELPDIDVTAVANLPKCFVAATVAGIEYAWDSIAFVQRREIHRQRVKIVEMAYTTVDSSTLVFVYAGAMALYDALGLAVEIPIKIDPETNARYICFPF